MYEFLPVGSIWQCSGDVTQLMPLIGKNSDEIERAIGYKKGRLKSGWNLLFLKEEIHLGDFKWGHITERSGGRDVSVEEFGGELFHPDSQDVLRYKIYKDTGFCETKADRVFNEFQERQVQLLQDRTSPYKIVKIFPRVAHDGGRKWWIQYPDAPRGQGISQWTLIKKKWFTVTANIGAGCVYRMEAGGSVIID